MDNRSHGVAKFLFFSLILCFDKTDFNCVRIALSQCHATGSTALSQIFTIITCSSSLLCLIFHLMPSMQLILLP